MKFNKYLIIICVIVFILVIYYFYDEISSIKQTLLPTYQKTMILEKKVNKLVFDVESSLYYVRKIDGNKKNTDTQVMSITYQSDLHNSDNNNLSIKYNDISESEAKNIINNLNKNISSKLNFNNCATTKGKNEYELILDDLVSSASAVNLIENNIGKANNENIQQKQNNDYKLISDSLQCVELPSENTLSELN